MQLKPIAAIIVLTLVVASLLVAGCTTNTANMTNQSPSTTPSTSTHDAVLEKFLAKVENNTHSSKDMVLKAWELTWINSTSARVQYAGLNKSINRTISVDATYTVFPTTQDASNYLNAMNKTEYSLASTIPTNDVYQNATGHAPQIYKNYEWGDWNTLNLPQAKIHEISQEDNLVIVLTLKILS